MGAACSSERLVATAARVQARPAASAPAPAAALCFNVGLRVQLRAGGAGRGARRQRRRIAGLLRRARVVVCVSALAHTTLAMLVCAKQRCAVVETIEYADKKSLPRLARFTRILTLSFASCR